MSDRTINWGDSEVEAVYQTGDDDPDGGGNFIVARDTDGGVTLLEYDPVAGEWVARDDVNLDGNDLSANVIDAAAVSADEIINNAVYSTKEDLPEDAEEGAQAYVSDQGELYLFEVSSPGEWVQAMPEPVRLKNDVNFLLRENVELRHELGLERLDYDNGWADGYFDKELIDSDTDLEGFNGEVSVVDTAAYGELTTTWQDFGFVPESVVIGQSVDGTESNPIVENGEQLEYEVAQGESVEDATMVFDGHDSTGDEQRSYAELEDGSTIEAEVTGTEETDITVTLSGGGGGEGEQEWTYTEHTNNVVGVAVDESTGTVFSGSQDDELHAIDASDGTQEWTYTEHTNNVVGVAVDESTGTVFSGSSDDEVHAIDASDGTQEWTYTEHTGGVQGVAVDESTGTVFSGSLDEEVHAIDAETGTQEWTYTEHTARVRGVAVDESTGTVFSGSQDEEVHAIDAETGTQEWTYTEHTGTVYGVAVDESTGTVFSASNDGEVHAIDASDGTQEWTYTEHAGDVEGVAVDESTGTVFSAEAGFGDDEVHAIDASDGTQEWTYTEHTNDVKAVAVDESTGTVFSGSSDDEVHAISTLGEAVDPSLSMAGETVSFDGGLGEDEEHTDSISNVAPDNYVGDVSLTDGAVDIDLSWTETTVTRDPTVTISSDAGTQDISFDGDIPDGTSEDVSNEIDESLIGGVTNISLSVSDGVDGPVGKTRVKFEHNGVEWSAGAGVFEIEDGDGNTESLLPIDDIQDLNFTDEQVRLNIQYVNGFGDPLTGRNYGVYLNGGE